MGKVWLDNKVKILAQVADDRTQIGAPVAWKAGYTGKGVTVAVLDTGIDDTHPDLAGKVADRKNFTDDQPVDHVGHGTHVASTIAGTGAASGGLYRGVAPDATLTTARSAPATVPARVGDPRRHAVGRRRQARPGRQHEPRRYRHPRRLARRSRRSRT